MISLYDLRENQADNLISNIKDLLDAPIKVIPFNSQSIRACIGCWSCWLSTPGRCVLPDEMAAHYPDYVSSDQVILLMDTAQGFISHLAKAFLDRTIPHYHPYIEIINQECHHVARYDRYPEMVFHFNQDGLTELETEVIENYLARTAFHFKTRAYRILHDGQGPLKPLSMTAAKRRQVPFGHTGPMGKLTVYDGSPRHSGSNTSLILNQAKAVLKDQVEIRDLKKTEHWDMWAKTFADDKHVMFFMPLYVHAMPSHVMAFMEKLLPSAGSISFFIQSGFPESSQSHFLEAYFEQLALRLDRLYLGTAIKGGVEGLQNRTEKAKDKLIHDIVQSLTRLVHEGQYQAADINKLAMPVHFGRLISTLIHWFGEKTINSYWDLKLKANHAYESRFDRPFSLSSVMEAADGSKK